MLTPLNDGWIAAQQEAWISYEQRTVTAPPPPRYAWMLSGNKNASGWTGLQVVWEPQRCVVFLSNTPAFAALQHAAVPREQKSSLRERLYTSRVHVVLFGTLTGIG